MSKYFLTLAALLAYCSIATATETLSYSVDLRHTEQKEVPVEVQTKGFTAKKFSYQMPAWAPGAYSMTNYGRFVKNFKAFDSNGKELAAKKLDENRWEVEHGKEVAKLTYTVINSYKDSTSLYFALLHSDTNYFFANTTALFGYVNDKKDVPSTVTYHIPSRITWKLYCALDEVVNPIQDKPLPWITFKAADYDELADAPVMGGTGFSFRSFNQGGATYEVALVGGGALSIDSLVGSLKEIAACQTAFFGDTPFKRYLYLISAPNFLKLPVQNSLGALEHANSSAYLLFDAEWPMFKQNGLGVFSHEFFHLWNVKRIHSDKLGPFDYAHRVMTTSLWLSEGITDYYANTLLSRCGTVPAADFERKISEWYTFMKSLGTSATETLEQLSIDESAFDLQKAMVFYTKAPLVALMLDIEIRTQTNNRKSLDDVMKALYAKAKKKQFFKDEDLIKELNKITGVNLTPFYNDYIAGKKELDLAPYLTKLGLSLPDSTTSSFNPIHPIKPTESNELRKSIYGG